MPAIDAYVWARCLNSSNLSSGMLRLPLAGLYLVNSNTPPACVMAAGGGAGVAFGAVPFLCSSALLASKLSILLLFSVMTSSILFIIGCVSAAMSALQIFIMYLGMWWSTPASSLLTLLSTSACPLAMLLTIFFPMSSLSPFALMSLMTSSVVM